MNRQRDFKVGQFVLWKNYVSVFVCNRNSQKCEKINLTPILRKLIRFLKYLSIEAGSKDLSRSIIKADFNRKTTAVLLVAPHTRHRCSYSVKRPRSASKGSSAASLRPGLCLQAPRLSYPQPQQNFSRGTAGLLPVCEDRDSSGCARFAAAEGLPAPGIPTPANLPSSNFLTQCLSSSSSGTLHTEPRIG